MANLPEVAESLNVGAQAMANQIANQIDARLNKQNVPIEFHRLHARDSHSETGVDIASQGMLRHEPIWERLVAWH